MQSTQPKGVVYKDLGLKTQYKISTCEGFSQAYTHLFTTFHKQATVGHSLRCGWGHFLLPAIYDVKN